MRFLQRHAELIVTVCVILSLLLGATLLWLVNRQPGPTPLAAHVDSSSSESASGSATPSPSK